MKRTSNVGPKSENAVGQDWSRMPVRDAREKIHRAVQDWPGVTSHPHRFGGTEYRLERREIGHVHADRLVDIPFPKPVRDELVSAGRANSHHVLPQSGWVSIYLDGASDVERAIELLRLSYEIATSRSAKQNKPTPPSG
jgi:luciferase-like monooxygenase